MTTFRMDFVMIPSNHILTAPAVIDKSKIDVVRNRVLNLNLRSRYFGRCAPGGRTGPLGAQTIPGPIGGAVVSSEATVRHSGKVG